MIKIKQLLKVICCNIIKFIPINNKRIVFSNFDGKKYGGDPRAISDYLKQKTDVEIIWLFESEKLFPLDEKLKCVKMGTLKSNYYIYTAKIWVDSHLIWHRIKRKNQIAIQTWHAPIPIKTIEGYESDFFTKEQKDHARISSAKTDLYISHSKLSSNIVRKGLYYDGDFLEVGYPSLDSLVSQNPDQINDAKDKICKKYSLNKEVRLFLYAPTYRDDDSVVSEMLPIKEVSKALNQRFGGVWVCLFRGHPLADEIPMRSCCNVSDYEFIEELLLACDICISDYSSIITDFMLQKRPGFLFAPDYEYYLNTRGFCIDYNLFPFPISYSKEEIINNIINYDSEVWEQRLNEFFDKYQIHQSANSTKKVCDYILNFIK